MEAEDGPNCSYTTTENGGEQTTTMEPAEEDKENKKIEEGNNEEEDNNSKNAGFSASLPNFEVVFFDILTATEVKFNFDKNYQFADFN
jgi:hypothetical protein